MSFIQYLKDTQGELRHVAWPTRLQTIIYTVLVVALSIGIALYLGFFDFIFTTGLSRALILLPHKTPPPITASTTEETATTYTPTSTPELKVAPIPVQPTPPPAGPKYDTKLPGAPAI